MPNIITHKIFAEEVLKKTTKKDIRETLEKHLQIYYIGSNGPDFLFFHNARPWEALKEHDVSEIGSLLHKKGINAFYERALTTIKQEKNAFLKESELAYLMGHLCHWALDKTTHPYIFYRTGDCTGESNGLHHRFESMMDTMMLEKFHHMSIMEYPTYEICAHDNEMLKAIARIYVPSVKEALDKELKVFDIRCALDAWEDIQKMLYDPKSRKIKAIKSVEFMLRKPWLLSGNIVPANIDESYDIMNEQHLPWSHPCDENNVSNASFLELFDEAVALAVRLLEKLYGIIEYDADCKNLINYLDDQAYDTGRNDEVEMSNFNIIYKGDKREDI